MAQQAKTDRVKRLKREIREEMKSRLERQSRKERRRRSRIIQKRLFKRREFLSARCVMLYVSRGTHEVETGPIIKKALQMGKKVVLPITLVKESRMEPVEFNGVRQGLKKARYGVYEPRISGGTRPARLRDIDLVVVPGLAFDRANNRLGRGKGYYDRFLRKIPAGVPMIGLGFRFQVVERLPVTRNDTPLTGVITD